ncbi:MAG TPA: hypothetical protein VEA69_16670 [Tepidisphaeraceae bacterium]|nr:hypothetical protein [Tepidisphaeraceae bacterium]
MPAPLTHRRKATGPAPIDNARYNGPTTDRPESWRPSATYGAGTVRTPGGKVTGATVRRGGGGVGPLAAPVRTDAINANASRYLASAGERMFNRQKVNNAPTAVVAGNQVYGYGRQGMNTFVAPPGSDFRFSGTTAPVGFSLTGGSQGNGGGAAGSTYGGGNTGVRGVRGGVGYGGVGGRGASGAIGTTLQADQNAANDQTIKQWQEALDTNASGQKAQQEGLESAYGGVYNTLGGLTDTIGATKGEAMGFLDGVYGKQGELTEGLGKTAHERENRRHTAARGGIGTSLAGRGLYNSTVLDSLTRGADVDSAFVHNAIDEDAARLKLGLMSNYATQGTGIITGAGQQLVGAGQAMAGAQQDFARQQQQAQQYGQGQRIDLLGSRINEGPNAGAYNNLLSQPGALGQRPASGGGGGGSNYNLDALLQQLLGGGENTTTTGGGFQPDPRTVAANERVRQERAAELARYNGQMSGQPIGGGTTTGGPANLIDQIGGGGGIPASAHGRTDPQPGGTSYAQMPDGTPVRMNPDGSREYMDIFTGEWYRV